MQYQFRSSHIPISVVNLGRKTYLTPNRAAASFYTERNEIDRKVTMFTTHTVTERDAYAAPTISYTYYRTIQYWWAICLYNGILFPTKELSVGKEIRIPDQKQLETYLSASRIGGPSSKYSTQRIVRV